MGGQDPDVERCVMWVMVGSTLYEICIWLESGVVSQGRSFIVSDPDLSQDKIL